jgi:hypothetical protein
VELPGVDHDPWVGDSDEVFAALTAFLAQTVEGLPKVATPGWRS